MSPSSSACVFLIALVCCNWIICGESQQQYAMMLYVITWSPTFCSTYNPSRPNCITTFQPNFYLHGLWAADSNGKTLTVSKKQPSDKDLRKVISRFTPALLKDWPSIKKNTRSKKLWTHEYKKHANGWVSAQDYFQAAISFRKKFNILPVLTTNELLPPDDHSVHTIVDIQAAVHEAIGSADDFYITCKKINDTHDALFELQFCIDATLHHLIPCPNPAPQSCKIPLGGQTEVIVFPATAS